MLKLKKIFAAFVGVATLANMAIPLSAFAEETTSYTYAYDNYKVDYSITNSWGSNQDVSVTITNTGTEIIENWMLAYDFNGQIESIWRADVASKNDMEYVRNAGYNANIAPNQSVNFGYSLLDVEGVPDTFVMCQKRLPKDIGYDVALNVNQSWGDSFNGEIVLTNTTDEPIECWELIFDTNFTITEISNSWAATVTELEPYSYMLKGTYTGTVAANSSVSLGFIGIKDGSPEISNISLTEVIADKVFLDCLYLAQFKDKLEDLPDKDNDSLPDIIEFYAKTNPNEVDTDGDGLSDYDEIFLTKTDPLIKDTDENGITDGNEDFDSDGLSNIDECLNKTEVFSADTDYDGLLDGEEINLYHSDPKNTDTDGDTLNDFDDVNAGFNPLLPDTDENGILDCDEKIFQTLKCESTEEEPSPIKSVSIAFEGNGNINSTSSILDISETDNFSNKVVGLVGSPYEIFTFSSFESAELCFEINQNVLEDVDFNNLGILWFNEEEQKYELIESNLNIEKSTISATVTHFSKYMVVDKDAWFSLWRKEIDYGTSNEKLNSVLAIDCSGSMSGHDPIQKVTDELGNINYKSERKIAAKSYLNNLKSEDKTAILTFNNNAEVICDFTDNNLELIFSLDNLYSSGGTSFNNALKSSISKLNELNEESTKIIILMTDGYSSVSDNILDIAVESGIKIYTIGLGSDIDDEVLRYISNYSNGEYYYAATSSELSNLYANIAFLNNLDMTDTDNDGLADIFEICGMKQANGEIVYTDPLNPDTDNDGLLDGQEIDPNYKIMNDVKEIPLVGSSIYFKSSSNPNLIDSDGDGLFDTEDPDCYTVMLSDLRIYQTKELPGYEENGYQSRDMACGDLTKSEIYKNSIPAGDMANMYKETISYDGRKQLFDNMRSLFKYCSMQPLQDVALDMIDHFRYANGSDYQNEILTEKVSEHESTQRFINGNTKLIVDTLKKYNGNIMGLAYSRKALHKGIEDIGYPHYDTIYDLFHGLTICIDDTHGNKIEITDYHTNGNEFWGTIRYTIYDHFGLDENDVKKYGWVPGFGFASWYTLQHYNGCEKQYKPFVTYVVIEEEFRGDVA